MKGMRYGNVTSPWTNAPAEGWQKQGRCQDYDPEAFFPISKNEAEEAKAICRRCDVQERCLQWALEKGEDFGIWGGMTQEERREFKRRHGVQAVTQ